MANPQFPGPKFTKIIEPNTDKQIVSVPLEEMGFGARKVSQDGSKKNDMTIVHIPNRA